MTRLLQLKKELAQKQDSKRAKILQGFFKTGKGEYGEGDLFLGITVPESRKVAKEYAGLSFNDISKLLKSKFHEERLVSLLILLDKYNGGDETRRERVYKFYLKSTKYINNWDLVDLSASQIVGQHLVNRNTNILSKLAKSMSLWERRISIISTYHFIKNNNYQETLKIAKLLLKDEEDLIHKAVGWMLREVGKRSLESETSFLKKHYKNMPRTMLRYAIERFPENLRQSYLKGKI